jgi:surfactin family lipopeptide synthetase A
MTPPHSLTEEEKKKLLYYFNDTDAEFERDRTVLHFFLDQVKKRPGAAAVLFKQQQMTYAQLSEKAARLAFLLRAKGVGPGTIVAIMEERSLEMMTGLFAIKMAGGAYLPIDPHGPVKRARLVLNDSGAPIVITQGKFVDKIEAGNNSEVINLDDPASYPAADAADNDPAPVNAPTDLAYVIYTSGSTGQPKGTMIQHRSLVNRLNWMQKKYPISEEDTLMQKTPIVFDVSVWELFWWSMTGASLCVMLPGFERFPQAIVETAENARVTVMHFVPSMMSVFLEYIEHSGDAARLGCLKQVFVSGEALKPAHVARFNATLYRRSKTRLTNLYGPTEATVDVTYFDCRPGEEEKIIPIGKPIDNTRMIIVDVNDHLCPVGVAGELCISGIGVARGYLNRPQLTHEKFVDCPFYADSKMYKTGDHAKWLPDGNIEFLGRMDHQVKIRGLRIELGEIESILSAHPAVSDCAVLVKESSETIVILKAFLVAKTELAEENQLPKEFKKYLKPILPEYMIPGEYRVLEALPLTDNGKVDRKRLASYC